MLALLSKLRHLLAIWLAQGKYSLAREMMFRGNFIIWIAVEVCWFVLQLVFIRVLYLHVDAIAGWTQWEMVLLVGLSQLVQQLFQTFFMVNFLQFPDLIREGKLDFLLLRPAPILFLVSIRQWDVGSILNSLLGAAVSVWALGHLGVGITAGGLAAAAGFVVLGVAFHWAIMLLLVTPAFWVTNARGFIGVYYQLFNIARQPREAFKGVFLRLFTWAIPVLLVANLPVRMLAGKGIPLGATAWLVAGTGVLCLAASWFFHFGLRRYTSASS
ncbi:ABC-2 type transport system permease protein [Verrucomicrobium sp. GAS474]|uniref:ABC transporter permease n=1 Tax=Verrucomicrobium sp. GAS474 TaxID=1882831 RepID=UPI00087CDFEE|nr:ABC-2 family transporter protein [Verrucomicrobium sp. GAS474]SDT96309.1 ABC-2 type transport system permease protein [Verrucomicrobium sp. GAS474]